MSQLNFSQSEIRLATATLATIAVIAPAIYYLLPEKPQEATEHVKTFRKYVKAYSTLRPQALAATASNDFNHKVVPLSLQLPARTLEPFQQHASMIFSLFESFSMIPQPPNHKEAFHFCKETNTVIAHCKMGGKVNEQSEKGKILIESGLREWWTECVLFVQMNASGKRVVEVKEFVDSAKAEELKKRLTGVLES
ncbi:hypothetical protein BS50DRAFT_619560 [Corynespora cassiicola Philippines]|uniref:Uncharacterized protein n=1 Tax=Corynespora cassiicola Philippines TaxID=1448308 RepID=A0A2T2NU25_CORCC|nr:hypothetical protein BS50DRAFT_619560 [Corynespora cassiicola Philippines]